MLLSATMAVSTKYSSAPVERFRLLSESETDDCKVSAAMKQL